MVPGQKQKGLGAPLPTSSIRRILALANRHAREQLYVHAGWNTALKAYGGTGEIPPPLNGNGHLNGLPNPLRTFVPVGSPPAFVGRVTHLQDDFDSLLRTLGYAGKHNITSHHYISSDSKNPYEWRDFYEGNGEAGRCIDELYACDAPVLQHAHTPTEPVAADWAEPCVYGGTLKSKRRGTQPAASTTSPATAASPPRTRRKFKEGRVGGRGDVKQPRGPRGGGW